jgi:hypothetical protein
VQKFSTFTILLSTEPPTFAPLVPPPYLPEIIGPIRELPPPEFPGIDDDEIEFADETEEIEIPDDIEEM